MDLNLAATARRATPRSDVAKVPGEACDLLVVGAGPAGLATAIFAAQAGLDVVLVAGQEGAQDKACGEGLMPAGVASLARMQVHVPVVERQMLRGVAYQVAEGCLRAEARFAPHAQAWGLARSTLSRHLHARARQLGVRLCLARLVALEQHPWGVVARCQGRGAGSPFTCAALHLVGADGLHSRVRRLAGLAAPSGGRRRFGLRRHLAQAPWSPYVEVYLAAGAEAYVTPVGPALINVAFLTEAPKLGWQAHLAKFPALARRLDAMAVRAAPPALGAGPFAQAVAQIAHGKVALVGDAAGYVDAITGEGVSLAFLAAEAAVQSLTQQRPARAYATAMRHARRHYAWHAGLLLWLTRQSLLHRPLLRLLRLFPRLFALWVGWAGRLPEPRSGASGSQ